ncbi:MAG: hypothetical protein A2171_00345 [Candidatus Levybacteria bacterium RBG_13_35_9]|nr:MAG: hypothetical protein A2171_00345 [Candidatus Levybacteria bacterium RBG_13_35_9]
MYVFHLTVFTTGAVIMVLEIVGSRVVAPYVGTSLPVWTSIIGIILASLSIGYFLGGRLADQKPNIKPLVGIIMASGISIAIIPMLQFALLPVLSVISKDIRINALVATTLLFTAPSILLGMVSPYVIRLKLNQLKKTGSTTGELYALSTIGSILGTFLAGFVLLAYFSSDQILFLLSGSLLLLTFIIITKERIHAKFILLLVFIFILSNILISLNFSLKNYNIKEFDSQYNKILIYDSVDEKTKKNIRVMRINTEIHSAMFLDSDGLVFDYTKFYRLAKHFNPKIKSALMLGGGAYSYPKDFLKQFPKASINVVEIDPKVTELARQYFSLKDNPRLSIYHEDGRTYINNAKGEYDVIFNDAFNSFFSIPFQLSTKEAILKMHSILSKDGIIMSNIISALQGEKSLFLNAELATYRSTFPYVYVFATKPNSPSEVQNVVLVAMRDKPKSFESSDKELSLYLKNKVDLNFPKIRILTDDFAPVDQYIMKLL